MQRHLMYHVFLDLASHCLTSKYFVTKYFKMVFKLKLKCSSFDGEELLRVSQQTMLRCSVENWPEVGMKWLLVTFVTTLSVKWRLMTSFYKMSNKLFEQTRKRNIIM